MSAGAYIGFIITAAIWIGQLIYTLGWQKRFTLDIETKVARIETDARDLKKWGETVVADRIKYNQENYLALPLFTECMKDTIRRLEAIEEYKIDSRLATIETQLAHVLTILEELKRR